MSLCSYNQRATAWAAFTHPKRVQRPEDAEMFIVMSLMNLLVRVCACACVCVRVCLCIVITLGVVRCRDVYRDVVDEFTGSQLRFSVHNDPAFYVAKP